MILLNLFGGPGSGKSTLAARIFSELKARGINAELVSEYAKDKVYEENKTALKNQLYLLAKQNYKIATCADKVNVIVTDSPLLLSIIYNKNPILGKEFDKLVLKLSNSYDSLNIFIKRTHEFKSEGRVHSEDESDNISTQILNLLNENNIDYEIIPADLNLANAICDTVIEKLQIEDSNL